MQLNSENRNKWAKNALIFFAPVLVIYLGFVAAALGDGFQPTDFIPDEMVAGSMILYIINTLLDLIRKLQPEE